MASLDLKIPIEDIRASFLEWLATNANVTSVVPASRFVVDGSDDQPTQSHADWIEPTVLDIDGEPSRGAREAKVVVDIQIACRPGTDMHRREEIAGVIASEISMLFLPVKKYSQGDPNSTWGHVRFGDSRTVNLGRVQGLNRGAVTVDGRYTPA